MKKSSLRACRKAVSFHLVSTILLCLCVSLCHAGAPGNHADASLEELARLVMQRRPTEDAGMIRRHAGSILRAAERIAPLAPESPEARETLLFLEALWRMKNSGYPEPYADLVEGELQRLAHVQLWDRATPVGSIEIGSSTNVLPADGHSTVRLTATVLAVDGTPLPEKEIRFYLPLGQGRIGRNTGRTDRQGQAHTTYTAPSVPGRDWILARVGHASSAWAIHAAGPDARSIDPVLFADGSSQTIIRAELYPPQRMGLEDMVRPLSFEIMQGGGSIEAVTSEIDVERAVYTAPRLRPGSSGRAVVRVMGANRASSMTEIELFTFRLRCPGAGGHSLRPCREDSSALPLEIEVVIEQVFLSGAQAFQVPDIDIRASVSGDFGLIRGSHFSGDDSSGEKGGFGLYGYSRTGPGGRGRFHYALIDHDSEQTGQDTVEIEVPYYGLKLVIPVFIDDRIHRPFTEISDETEERVREEEVLISKQTGALTFVYPERWSAHKEDEGATIALNTRQGYHINITKVNRQFTRAWDDIRYLVEKLAEEGWKETRQGSAKMTTAHDVMRLSFVRNGDEEKLAAFAADRQHIYVIGIAPPSFLFGAAVLEFDKMVSRASIDAPAADISEPAPVPASAPVTVVDSALCEELDSDNMPSVRLEEIKRTRSNLIHWFMINAANPVSVSVKWHYEDEYFPFFDQTLEFPAGLGHANYSMRFSPRRRLKTGTYVIRFKVDDKTIHEHAFQVE